MRVSFQDYIRLLMVTQGRIPLTNMRYFGEVIHFITITNPHLGLMSQFLNTPSGIILAQVQVFGIAGCGDVVGSWKELRGICQHPRCWRICCKRPGCLRRSDFSGETLCKQHYVKYRNIIIGKREQIGLWRPKAYALSSAKEREHEKYLQQK